MIYTCSHDNYNSYFYLTYAISGNRGRNANYKGNCYSSLAPKKDFWNIWKENPNNLSPLDNNRYYTEMYYLEVLKNLDARDIYNELNNSILLCYEEPSLFCHRHIVAAWFEIELGIEVSEVRVDNYTITKIERPSYYKEWLTEFINKDTLNRKMINKNM